MTKKIIAIFILVVALALLAGLAYFLIVPQKAATVDNQPAPSEPAPELKSFRGVLAEIFEDAGEKAEKIKEDIIKAVPNPFAAPKAPEAASGLTFAVIGDTQNFSAANPQGNFQRAVKNISAANPDLVLAMGDLTSSCDNYSECTEKHNEWKKVDAPLLSKTYAAMGNHDNVKNKGVKAWQEAFDFPVNGPAGYSETVYSLDYKNAHFVILNSDHEKEHVVNGDQRAWLEKDLAANKKEDVFVFFHEPAYPVSSKIGESLDVEPSERNALWAILAKYNVTAVFSGHEHIVSRRKVDGIYQFVFGNTDSFNHDLPKAGVAEYASQTQGSYGLVKVSGKEITVETRGPDGKVLDTFTFSK